MSNYKEEARAKYDQRLYSLTRAYQLKHIGAEEYEERRAALYEDAFGKEKTGLFKSWANPFRPQNDPEDNLEGGRTASLVYPPGWTLAEILKFILPKKIFEDIVVEAVADMRVAYFEALADKKPLQAKWVVVRDHIRAILAVVRYFFPGKDGA